MLKGADADGKDLQLMSNPYWIQKSSMFVADEESSSQVIKRGVRQGSVLSPEMFNLYIEMIMLDRSDSDGIKFGGRNINNVRYADYTALFADSDEILETLVQSLVRSRGERNF